MRVMSAGTGYRYLLKSVVAADGDRDLSTPLTRYYTEQGTPPGFWLGSGLADLGDGQLRPGDVVTEAQLQLLLGQGRDPVSGQQLGRAFPDYQTKAERVVARVAQFDPGLTADQHTAEVAMIEAEESVRTVRRAVAGFDYTFSAPKSVSVWWALADPDTQSQIVAAHHAAVADVIRLMEREVAATRTGSSATDGAVAQVDVEGLIATGFDHYDSRAGDPQLHTHVVISNKVKTVWDGKWRSLDSRPMHAATVALSEHYNAMLADQLTRRLGIGWEQRARGRDRNPAWEITGIPQTLIEAFSSRSRSIEVEKDRLIDDYRGRHGHRPSATTIIKLRAQATLTTRPDKTVQSLEDLTRQWQARASQVLGHDTNAWSSNLTGGSRQDARIDAGGLAPDVITEVGRRVVAVVGEKRSTWRRWNLHAEASRQTMRLRFVSTTDRETALDAIVDAAEGASLRLTPPELAATPVEFRRADGTSVFRPKHAAVFTSAALLEAEDRLITLARTTTGSVVPMRNIGFAARRLADQNRELSDDQVAALIAVGTSGRTVDVLVGPAGAGKTTAMTALRKAWELSHGPASVIGLAPSSTAAQVLADDLGIPTENTAKWLHDHTAGRAGLNAGQLVIIDEASLAGTHTLDRITCHAAEVGAKVLLVGDWAQLGAVEAGGAFGMLVRDRTDPAELTDIHRFHRAWEKQASLQLRNGDAGVIDTYQTHDRLQEGHNEMMLDGLYQAWRDDLAAGRTSLMIASTHETVTVLNRKARHDRILTGRVNPTNAVRLHDQTHASPGDVIVTRHNNRRLIAGKDWVKNGDRWSITATHNDGSLTARREGQQQGGAVRLPSEYVAEHVELGYAVTTHRAQGATVDTAHTIVGPGMTREAFYVSMTRGRQANTAYVITDQAEAEPHHQPSNTPTAQSVLRGVLGHVGAEQSAHQTIRSEHDRWSTIAQLAAEYETIAAAAQHDRWTALIRNCGLGVQQAEDVIASEAFGPLTAELRRTEAHHRNPDALLPQVVAARPLDDASDIAAVLHHRLNTAATRYTGTSRRPTPRLIAGLVPEAVGLITAEMRHALNERKHLIEQRAQALAEYAVNDKASWIRHLGSPPREPRRRQVWIRHVQTVAAYRDRYQITTDAPLGQPPAKVAHRSPHARVHAAVLQARSTAALDHRAWNSAVNKPKQNNRPTGPSL